MGQFDPRIKIRAPLRCDGIGSLDCAEDVESGQRMAVRWLPLEANAEHAVRAITQLPAHPTLPRIRSTGRVGQAAWVAMDFPEGQTLSVRLTGPLPADEVLRVGQVVSEGLAALHAQGVVHGELSTDSVLMLPDGRVVLWDVPLVVANRHTDRRGEQRQLGQMVKQAPYLAPERARGGAPSMHGDLYALGAMLCIAAGARPPPSPNTLGVLHAIATGQWAPAVPHSLPDWLKPLVNRMLALDPQQRPSASFVAKALSRCELPPAPPPELGDDEPTVPSDSLPPVVVEPAIQGVSVAPRVSAPTIPLWMYGVMSAVATLIIVLSVVAIALATRKPTPVIVPEVPTVVPAGEALPAEPEEDLLAPLSSGQRRPALRRAARPTGRPEVSVPGATTVSPQEDGTGRDALKKPFDLAP